MRLREYKSFLSAFFIIAVGGLLFYFAQPFLPSRIFTENTSNENIVVDSLMINAINDLEKEQEDKELILSSTKSSVVTTQNDSLLIKIPTEHKQTQQKTVKASNSKMIQITDFNYQQEYSTDSTGLISIPSPLFYDSYKGLEHLDRFFEKLYNIERLKQGKVRIAYYGDSMIDGDLIVQDFRSALQSRFGGRGVGFVSIKSESARSRYSVKHYSKGNWKENNYMKNSTDSIPYGINGAVFFPSDSTASVKYLASGIKNSTRLNSPKLFYGKGNETAILKVTEGNDSIQKEFYLNGKGKVNSILLSNSNLKRIELNFSNVTETPIYGIEFSNATGVAVDGFSNRGNSGLPLSLLDISQMNQFDNTLSYDLIILQYGANVLTRKSKNYNWYRSRMTKVVQHLQLAFPESDILILGTADRGTKIENEIKTDSSVVKLLRSQQQYAAATESAFFSLFHLMGGVNTMPIWSKHKLANTDFTHFSSKGSRKIGRLLYAELMDGYSAFAKARTKETSLPEKETGELITDTLKIKTDRLKPQQSP
jgi:lysophospholipase L1-like esterase